jgi:hypothetical protein
MDEGGMLDQRWRQIENLDLLSRIGIGSDPTAAEAVYF